MSRTADRIKHIGTITSIDGGVLRVKMLQSSACSGCHAAHLCQSSESKEKEVDVTVSDASSYSLGQHVLLIGSVRQGLKATLWAYMVPLVLIVLVMAGCLCAKCNDGIMALVTLLVLVVYFCLLYLFRDKLERKFSFEVERL